MGCLVDIPTALVTFLVTGGWIMRNSIKPEKVSIMLIGSVGASSDLKVDMEKRVNMFIKQSKRNRVDNTTVKEICCFAGQKIYMS
eukprot:15366167-Ditylum_brightwellii.AAC.2